MQIEELFAAVFCFVVLSGVLIVFLGLRQRSQQLEMRHKERMAMIERGMSPASSESPRLGAAAVQGSRSLPASRSLTLGIVIVAFGLALATVISFAGESPEVGVGIGGGIAIIGAGFIVNSLVARGPAQPQLPPSDDQM